MARGLHLISGEPARRLRIAREKLGFSQGDFANKLGIKQQGYGPYETGGRRITVEFAQRVSAEFGVSSYWILDGNGDMMISKDDPLETKAREAYLRKSNPQSPSIPDNTVNLQRQIDDLRSSVSLLNEQVKLLLMERNKTTRR